MKRWYVVHALARMEELARQNLQAQGFQVFLPRYHRVRRHARKTDVVLAPLFPRYLFVVLDLDRDRWLSVESTRGVAYLLRQKGTPLAVPRGVIENLQQQADPKEIVPLASLEIFKPGTRLEIQEGAFKGQVGFYQKMTDNDRVLLLLNLLGQEVAVSASVHAVNAVA